MKITLKTEAFSMVLIALALVSSIYFYNNFPDKVPTHWNFAGEIDGWSSRGVGAFLIPIMIVVFYLVFLTLPFIDPKKERYEEFKSAYNLFKNLIITLFFALYIATGFAGLGYNIPIGTIVPIGIGLLFIALGNYLGKIKPNWFMGVRTPWTMSSEKVWNKTHRVAGRIFVVSGLVMMLEPFMPMNLRLPIFIIMIFMLTFGTIFYSYIAYRQEKKELEKK